MSHQSWNNFEEDSTSLSTNPINTRGKNTNSKRYQATNDMSTDSLLNPSNSTNLNNRNTIYSLGKSASNFGVPNNEEEEKELALLKKNKKWKICTRLFTAATVVIFLAIAASVITVALYFNFRPANPNFAFCGDKCNYIIGESIPQQLELELFPNNQFIYQIWLDLINNATKTIEIAAFYWTLNNTEIAGGGVHGNDVFNAIVNAAKERKVQIRIAQSQSDPTSGSFNDLDSAYFAANGIAQVVNVNFEKLFQSGVLHTKLIVVDDQHAFIGSANMDWRSFSQVKELGVAIKDCPCVALDVKKIWEIYFNTGLANSTLPKNGQFNQSDETVFNANNRFSIGFVDNDTYTEPGTAFIGSAPKPLDPPGREFDLDSIIDTINNSTEFVYISVMDYIPAMIYTPTKTYWGKINDALMDAALSRNVHVRVLASKWNYTANEELVFLNSFNEQGAVCFSQTKDSWCSGLIEVMMFEVPDLNNGLVFPFTRVNHAKYMVTEKQAYIGTSNWTKDYFYTTAGVGIVLTHPQLRQNIQDIFLRDWNSEYTHPVSEFISCNGTIIDDYYL